MDSRRVRVRPNAASKCNKTFSKETYDYTYMEVYKHNSFSLIIAS